VRKLILLPILVLIVLIGLAVPASANHANWDYPTNGDVLEVRDTPKIRLSGYWCIFPSGGTTREDLANFSVRNDGYAGHYFRAQLERYSDHFVIYDSGQFYLGPGESDILFPRISSREVGTNQEFIVEVHNDVGNQTFLDVLYNVPDDANYIYPIGSWDCSA
jgi:hypothetical protein